MDPNAILSSFGVIPAIVTFIVVLAVFSGLFGINIPFFNVFGGG